jgi:hypothetical protein
MKILNDEQLAYLKSLESPKKRRKFMLDCLMENTLGESVKFIITPEGLKPMSDEISDLIDSGKAINWYTKSMKDVSERFDEMVKEMISDESFSIPKRVINKWKENIPKIQEAHCKFNEEEINRLNSSYQTSTAPATLKGLLNFCGVSEEQMSKSVFRESAKSNYNSEEIEIAKSLNSERDEKKWTDEDMIRAFEKGNHATCNAFLVIPFHKAQTQNYLKQKDEFIKSLKND